VTLAAGLTMLVFAIMQGASWGWTQGIIVASLASGIALLSLFVLIELRRPAPLIDVALFRNASFSACTLVFFAGQFSKMTIIVFGALFLQDKLGMSPLIAGLALLAAVGGFPILSAPAGRLADRIGARRPVLGGMALATLAMAWIGLAAGWDSYLLLLPGLILWGIGLPFCYAPATRAMANAVPVEKQGQLGGIAVTARLLGGTIGVSVCSTLLIMTGHFQGVFLATGAIMFSVLLFGWFAIEPRHGARAPTAQHPTGAWGHS
jgi:MFS family permease